MMSMELDSNQLSRQGANKITGASSKSPEGGGSDLRADVVAWINPRGPDRADMSFAHRLLYHRQLLVFKT